VVDLALWHLLEIVQDNGFEAALAASCPALAAFARRIVARPRIAAYVASAKRPHSHRFRAATALPASPSAPLLMKQMASSCVVARVT
jgi:hypothetical protein